MNNNEKEIKYLEQKISDKFNIYSQFKKSDLNEQYFNRMSNDILSKVNNKTEHSSFHINPAFGYALLFILSFLVSLEFSNFGNVTSYSTSSFLFSETSLWVEEEQYLSDIELEGLNLDYENYFDNEINFYYNVFVGEEINDLSVNQLNSIYENIKTKKIL